MKTISQAFSLFILTSMILACGEGQTGKGPEMMPAQGGETPLGEVAPTTIAMLSETPVPSPEPNESRPTTTSREYGGESLEQRLADYFEKSLSIYNSKGNAIILENIDKPTGKAAFDIQQDSFTLAFGVNGESWLTLADGERNVVMDFDNYTDPATGQKIENMYAYSIYLDPDTRQITDTIDENSLRVPVLTEIRGVNGQPSKLIYLDWHNPLMSEADFYDVVAAGKPADALLSLVSPNILQDIVSAPDFVNEINFDGDWKVVYDQDGNSIMIDAANGEELGKFENGSKWVEAMSPAESQLHVDMEKWGIDLSGKDAEKYSATISGEDVTVVDQESGEIIYKNGSWEPLFLGRMIKASENGCKVTPFVSDHIGPTNPPDIRKYVDQYSQPLVDVYLLFVKKRVIPTSGMIVQDYNMGDGCWGEVFYRQKGVSQPVAWYFWKDALGRVKEEKVFVDVTK